MGVFSAFLSHNVFSGQDTDATQAALGRRSSATFGQYQNQGAGSHQNQDDRHYQNQDDRHYQNQDDRHYQNQGAGSHQNQNYQYTDAGRYQNQGTRQYQNQDDSHYQNQGDRQYQNRDAGSYQNQDDRSHQNQGARRYQNQDDRQYQNRGVRSHQNQDDRQYQNQDDRWDQNRGDRRFQSQGDLAAGKYEHQWQNIEGQPTVMVRDEGANFEVPDITAPPYICRPTIGWTVANSHPTIRLKPEFVSSHQDFMSRVGSLHVRLRNLSKKVSHWDAYYPLGDFPTDSVGPAFPASRGAHMRFWTFCPRAGRPQHYELQVGAYDKHDDPIEYFREEDNKIRITVQNDPDRSHGESETASARQLAR